MCQNFILAYDNVSLQSCFVVIKIYHGYKERDRNRRRTFTSNCL